jgi:hypothetical protein
MASSKWLPGTELISHSEPHWTRALRYTDIIQPVLRGKAVHVPSPVACRIIAAPDLIWRLLPVHLFEAATAQPDRFAPTPSPCCRRGVIMQRDVQCLQFHAAVSGRTIFARSRLQPPCLIA